MSPLPLSRWFILVLSLLVLSGCISYRDLRPGRTKVGAERLEIPARIVGSHFVVETKWDKHGPWRFLIDTGSTVTLVSAEFTKRYEAENDPTAPPAVRVKSAEGDSTLLPAVTVRRIGLGEAQFDNVQALIGNLDDISAHLGEKIDGVLGFPLFRNTVFTLDYPQSQLVIIPRHEAARITGTTIKFNNAQRIPLIPVHVGNATLIALLDSGSDGPLFLNPFGLELNYAVEPRTGTTVGTLTGNRQQQIGRLEDPLEIGPYRFPNPVVDLTDQLTSIGGEILRNFAVTFDQGRNQVTFSREDTSPILMMAKRMTGLAFAKGPTYWRVIGVVPGSPAEKLGVQPGDLVTRINGESIADWPLQRFDPYVRRSKEVIFTFLDGAREKPVVVPTFELVP
jgi:hypothetical protein